MWWIVVVLFCLIAAFFFSLYKLAKAGRYILFFTLLVSPYLSYKMAQYFWFRSILPEQIAVTGPVSIGEEGGIREGCGVAVFRLSTSTRKAIEAEGLEFFEGVDQSRGYSDHYHSFSAWKESPVPQEWGGDGSMFMCSVISPRLARKIQEAARLPGAYYATKHEGQLYVLPSIGLVVFSFYG